MAELLFNDLVCFRRRSGIGHYAALLLQHLPLVAPDLKIVRLSELARAGWIAKAMQATTYRDSAVSVARLGGVGKVLRTLGMDSKQLAQAALDAYLAATVGRKRWGLIHEPDAIAFPTHSPTLVSVMDLSVILYPQWHPAHRVKKYEKYFMRSLKQSAFFVAISEATKADMIENLKVKADQIAAIPLAPRGEFRPVSSEVVAQAQKKWKLGDSYLLFVGNLEPRKNVAGLLRAYSRLPTAVRNRCPLVLVGGWGWNADEIQSLLRRSPWKESVRHLGYLPDADLVAVVQGATALVYPSFYEGFGLPPLEAMAVGTPVICSTRAGLAEAVGDAASIVDPEDEIGITQAMKSLLENPELRKEYRAKGFEQSARFTWEKTASKTAEVYRTLLTQKS